MTKSEAQDEKHGGRKTEVGFRKTEVRLRMTSMGAGRQGDVVDDRGDGRDDTSLNWRRK
jgi:hypothetical protein